MTTERLRAAERAEPRGAAGAAALPPKPAKRRLGAFSPVMFEEEGALVSTIPFSARTSADSDSEAEPSEQQLAADSSEAFPDCRHRRTFHHTYYQSEDGQTQIKREDSMRDTSGSTGRAPMAPIAKVSFLLEQEEADLEDCFRDELIRAGGGAMEAFRCIDLSGSGHISQQEFEDGVSRLGVPWREVTGLGSVRELFKRFASKDGVIRLHDLFPEVRLLATPPNRMSTPEFWTHWCRNNGDEFKKRGPKWKPADQDGELQTLFDATRARQDVADRKRWMSSTIRRMKSQGKSDARCRELCATHLPRGTGPRDNEHVHTFSQIEVKNCRRDYNDKVSGPVRNIQKTVYEMREQRKELEVSRRTMWRMTQRNARVRKQVDLKESRLEDPDDLDDLEEEEGEESGV